jgi:hypothetical protein
MDPSSRAPRATVTPEKWQQITAIFHEALARDVAARGSFVAEACAGDEHLRNEVDAMLAAHADAGAFGDVPILPTSVGSLPAESAAPAGQSSKHPFVWVVWSAAPILAAMFLYGAWVLVPHSGIAAPIGWTEERRGAEWFVSSVDPAGPAAGSLREGDRIVSLDRTPPLGRFGTGHQRRWLTAGSLYQLAIDRGGQPLDLRLLLPERGSDVSRILGYFLMSLAWCAVGVFIGLARPEDPVARLGAIAAAITGMEYLQIYVIRSGTVLQPMHLVVGSHFFLRFPAGRALTASTRLILTPLYVAGVMLAMMGLWLQATMLLHGGAGTAAVVNACETLFAFRTPMVAYVLYYSLVVMVGAIAVNYRRLNDEDQRRRLQWVVYGSIAFLTPQIVRSVIEVVFGAQRLTWMEPFSDVCTAGIPLVFAYAIVKHRVFDIRVVIRRGLRYLFARQALQLLVAIPLVVLAVDVVRDRHLTVAELVSRNTGYLFWIAAALAGLRFRGPVNGWLDRRFFREQYDREQLLLRTFDSLTRADSLEEISGLLREHLELALHPTVIHIWYRDVADSSLAPPAALLTRIEGSDAPIELPRAKLTREEARWATRLDAHLVVPITDGSGRVAGAIALGAKKSEEPYNAGDCSLLQAIGKQIGVAGETLRLRAQVGEDRRIRHDVLAKLSSQHVNLLKQCPACGRCFDAPVVQCDHDGQTLTLSLPVERTIASRYRLDRLIGKGGMGAVYEARDLRLDRLVAIKILLGRAFGDRRSVRRFEREARAAARLNHRNIVSVYDVGHLEGEGAFLVMERIHGVTMRDELTRAGPLPAADVAGWFDQMLEGLAAAHAGGVVHRDLKPDNVIAIRSGPGGFVVKILDFGLAKLRADEASTSGTITIDGGTMGTFGYISPEQLAGREVDHRTDIFAAGVMLAEALTGSRPFAGDTCGEFARAVEAPYHLPATVPGWCDVDAVLQRCLARDSSDRFSSASLLRDALMPALRACAESR